VARPIRRDVKQYRKDISKLKRLGLYAPKSDKVTSYGKKQVREYSDVLAGRATVVKAKGGRVHVSTDIKTKKKIFKELSAAQRASTYRGILRVKNDRIIVKSPPDKKPRFNKRTGEIDIDVKNVGKVVRGRLVPVKITDIDDLHRIEMSGYYLALPLWHGTITYDDVDELIRDLTEYFHKPSLARYVILVPKKGFVPDEEHIGHRTGSRR